jgi:tRNA nucleotidyltransferase (CCA-adding enzyme)
MIELTIGKFIELIPEYVLEIAEELEKAGYEAYLVGGSIRDILIGKQPYDFDVATNAYPEEVVKIFPKSIPTGAKFGTITVVGADKLGEKYDVQVTTYRAEADYIGGRWPAKVEFTKTIQEDLSRRDFTINAIALDLQKFDNSEVSIQQILVDPFDGLKDLENKLIKAVNDPIERFSEDGLRAVRACRLASQLDFEIDNKTFEAIKQTLHVTKIVSIERFKEEFVKILNKSPKPSKGLMLLKESGILELFIPELLEGVGINQPEFHTEDVFEHSIHTCDVAEDSIKLAALFHDIGKPRTRSEDAKGIHFYGHDVVGAEMTEGIMKRLRFSNAEIEHTVRLVRWHMFYYPSADWRRDNKLDDNVESKDSLGWTDAAVRRLIQNVGGEDAIDDLMKLRIADASSNPKNDFNPKEIDVLSERIASVRAKEMALKVTDLDITGEDLISNFDLEPGKKVGDVLKYLLDKVIEDPLYNKKLDLLRLAKEYLERFSV